MPAPSLVVPVNSTTSAAQGISTLLTNNDAITIDCSNYSTLAFDVTGTWTATISYESSVDGTTFSPHQGLTNLGASASTNRTANGQLLFNVAAINFLRMRISAYTSGSPVITWSAVAGATGPTPVLIGTSSALNPGTGAANMGKAEDAAHTTGDTGIAVWGVRNDTALTTTNTDGDYSQLSVTGQGAMFAVGTLPVLQGSLGLTVFRQIAAGTTNATSIKAASGSVTSFVMNNTSASIKYIKFYNKASAPTVGTDTPLLVFGIPPTTTIVFQPAVGFPFSTGIASATTALGTDADATAVTASDVSFTIVYK